MDAGDVRTNDIPLTANTDWTHIALYAVGAALLLLMLLFPLPVVPMVGRALRIAMDFEARVFCISC